MGAVKTNHKRDAHLRTIAKVCRKWDREDQAAEAAEVRRHNRAVKAHKMKRLYPNSIAPERQMKLFHAQLRQLGKTMTISELAMKRAERNIQRASEALTTFAQSIKQEDKS